MMTNCSCTLAASLYFYTHTHTGFVPMTPLIIPGAAGDVPMMTWGEVESTPLRIHEPFEVAEDNMISRGFKIQEPTHREKVATKLEAKTHRKGSSTPKVSKRIRSREAREGL